MLLFEVLTFAKQDTHSVDFAIIEMHTAHNKTVNWSRKIDQNFVFPFQGILADSTSGCD
jgi:hypothetical protein